MTNALLLLLAGLPAIASPADSAARPATCLEEPPRELRIDRGAEQAALYVPRRERLVYAVHVKAGFARVEVGKLILEAGVEPYRESALLAPSAAGEGEGEERETAWLRSTAIADYGPFHSNAVIETRHLPKDWPRIHMLREHKERDARRREILIGEIDGTSKSRYRRDSEEGAPKGARIWQEPKLREVPRPTLDMLSGMYLTRTMIREGKSSLRFPLVDKKYLWEMRVRRGAKRRQETPVGLFDAVEIKLDVVPHPEESAKRKQKQSERFSGLFGMEGTVRVWVDQKTGIPVRVQGEVPMALIDLEVDAVLNGYKGVPEEFRPL